MILLGGWYLPYTLHTLYISMYVLVYVRSTNLKMHTDHLLCLGSTRIKSKVALQLKWSCYENHTTLYQMHSRALEPTFSMWLFIIISIHYLPARSSDSFWFVPYLLAAGNKNFCAWRVGASVMGGARGPPGMDIRKSGAYFIKSGAYYINRGHNTIYVYFY